MKRMLSLLLAMTMILVMASCNKKTVEKELEYELNADGTSYSVTGIGAWEEPLRAFRNCSSLTSILYGGTVAEWETIEKGTRWDENTGKYSVTCTDGTVEK